MSDFVPDQFNEKAALYKQRNALYGDAYKQQGKLMAILFPGSLPLISISDHNRYAIFQTMVSKIYRYAANFEKGGHEDSLDDICVYSMMLKELDVELAKKRKDNPLKESNNGL